MNKEMTINQINGKIKRIEGNISGYRKSISMYQKWLTESKSENDSKRYKSTIRDYEKKINKCEAQLAELNGMKNGKVKEYPEVRKFVEAWKKACIDHITAPETIKSCLEAYETMKQEQKKIEDDCKAKGIPSWSRYQEMEDLKRYFLHSWGFVFNYLKLSDKTIRMEELDRDYKYEAERKYNKFIEDAEFYVGEITDASDLSVGKKGDLNGWVVGKKGKAEVETISACGEIQRFHYRTLFKMAK